MHSALWERSHRVNDSGCSRFWLWMGRPRGVLPCTCWYPCGDGRAFQTAKRGGRACAILGRPELGWLAKVWKAPIPFGGCGPSKHCPAFDAVCCCRRFYVMHEFMTHCWTGCTKDLSSKRSNSWQGIHRSPCRWGRSWPPSRLSLFSKIDNLDGSTYSQAEAPGMSRAIRYRKHTADNYHKCGAQLPAESLYCCLFLMKEPVPFERLSLQSQDYGPRIDFWWEWALLMGLAFVGRTPWPCIPPINRRRKWSSFVSVSHCLCSFTLQHMYQCCRCAMLQSQKLRAPKLRARYTHHTISLEVPEAIVNIMLCMRMSYEQVSAD